MLIPVQKKIIKIKYHTWQHWTNEFLNRLYRVKKNSGFAVKISYKFMSYSFHIKYTLERNIWIFLQIITFAALVKNHKPNHNAYFTVKKQLSDKLLP